MANNEVLIRRSEVVRIHLDTLSTLAKVPDPGPAEAIIASMSLRFLFDNTLAQVAHGLGIPLTIPAPTLDEVPLEQAIFFACGGYEFGGAVVSPHYSYRVPGPKSPHRKQYERQLLASPAKHAVADVKFGRFGMLPCLGLMGEVVSREATVRYVANKCGGAHHHDDDAKFDKIEQRLTQVGHTLRASGNGTSAVFMEVLGTAWFLSNAPAISVLRAAL